MDVTLKKFLDEAKHLPEVETVVIMGAYGSQDPTDVGIGSDIDLYIIADATTTRESLLHMVKRVWPNDVLYHFFVEHKRGRYAGKLAVYLKDPYVKLDLAFGPTMEEYSRYLRGSEKCYIAFDKTGTAQERLSAIMDTKACDCLPEYKPAYHVVRFLEAYETLCKSIARKDAYRVQFYGNLILHALVVLEMIVRQQRTAHLYLPKDAFSQGLEAKKLQCITFKEHEQAKLWSKMEEYTSLFVELASTIQGFKKEGLQNFLNGINAHYRKFI